MIDKAATHPAPAPAPASDPGHLAVRLRSSTTHLSRRLRSGMPSQSLGAATFAVMGHLYRGGHLTPTQLAQHERVKLQTLTRLLAELESAGTIRRRPHPHDGRQTLLSLTARGVRELTAEVKRREASLALALADELDARERATLLRACDLIDRIAARVGEAQARSATRAAPRGTRARGQVPA